MVDIFVASKSKNLPKKAKPSQKISRKRRKELLSGLKKKKNRGLGPRYVRVAERLHKQRRKGNLRAFQVMPGRVRFETQEVRERVILLLRQHWVTQVRWALMVIAMMALPVMLKFIPLISFMPKNYQIMTVLMWYLLTLAVLYEKFISWFYRVFIVTDERVIDIDFYHLLYKEISDAKIDNIEDVTYSQGGMLKTMLNYGDVILQTAAEQRQFLIESVPEPDRVAKILNELKLEEEQEKIEGRVR